MSVIRGGMRTWQAQARRVYFEEVDGIPFNDVQNAIAFLALTGPQLQPTAVTAAMSPYAVQSSDTILFVDASAGSVQINLQASATRGETPLIIKDVKGKALTNVIQISAAAAETIDGNASEQMMGNFDCLTLKPNIGTGYALT